MEGDVVRRFATLVNGKVVENRPFLSVESRPSGLFEILRQLEPDTYGQLSDEAFKALFLTHPCTAWGMGKTYF